MKPPKMTPSQENNGLDNNDSVNDGEPDSTRAPSGDVEVNQDENTNSDEINDQDKVANGVGDEGVDNTDISSSGLSAMPGSQLASDIKEQANGKEEFSSQNSSVVQFLALYLLVLAFFIWLVSLARFEGVKSLAVINSLKSTFEAKKEEQESTELQTLIRKKITSAKQFEDSIRGLFSTLLGVEKVEAPTPGRTMRVVMNTETLFEPEKTKIKEFNYAFMDRVIASLSERPPGYHFDMEFVIGSNEDASGYGTLPVEQTLQMARAGVFVRSMLARGAPPDTISVGVRKGNPDSVAMWFYIRSPLEVDAYYAELKKPSSDSSEGKEEENEGERTTGGR